MRNFNTGLVSLLAIGITNSGCYEPKPMPDISVEDCTMNHLSKKFIIGAELFDTRDENKLVFNSKINNEGFLPIYFVIENKSNNLIVAYGTQNVEFIDGENLRWPEIGVSKMSDETDRDLLLAKILSVNKIAGVIAESLTNEYNTKMLEDYISKVLPSQAEINPYQKRKGFVIFGIPNNIDSDEFFDRIRGGSINFKVYKKGEGVERILLKNRGKSDNLWADNFK